MYELLKLFFDICRFKKGPQDIPDSKLLLHFLILVYASTHFLILTLSSDGLSVASQVIVEIILVLGMSWIILYVVKKPVRFQQTTNALLGTDALISFFTLPVMATLIGQGSALAFIALVLLIIWHWAISGHIFRNALDQPLAFGLGVSFMYLLTSYQVTTMLFPPLIIAE